MVAGSTDRMAALTAVFGFSLSLGVATVSIPLLALSAGYDPAAVGFLVATSAASQFGARLTLPILLGRFADRSLIGASSLLMAMAFVLLVTSTALPVFVVAQLCAGAARAIFWTSSQTHAVRGDGPAVRGLVDLNVIGNTGTLAGPALGGMLAVFGLPVALAAAALGAAGAAVAAVFMRPLPPYDRTQSAGTVGLLSRDGVDVACWASVAGGTWWSMIGSYIPVILVGAGLGTIGTGWLVSGSEAAGMIALLVLRRLPERRIGRVVRGAGFVAIGALIGVAVAPARPEVYALLLAVGGAASGTVTTLAPAMASLAAGPNEQGDALALSGTFRAGALFAAPAAVGSLLVVLPIAGALALVGAIVALPGVAVGSGRIRRRPSGS